MAAKIIRDVDKAQNIMDLASHMKSLNFVTEKNGQ